MFDTADLARNCSDHFLWEERFAAHGGYHSLIKAPLPVSIKCPLKDVGAEDDSNREDEMEIFIPDPNMDESETEESN